MVAFTNVTIDDSSSLILYDPPDAWASPSGNDAQAYMNSTFHGTSISGATAKLTFNGTGVWLYGANRPDYGSFILVVDDEVSAYSNATAPQATYGQLLGGVQNLEMGEHVVTIMNAGSGPIDLDAIVYETVGDTPQSAPPSVTSAPSSSDDSTVPSSSTSSTPASTQSGRVSAKPHAAPGSGDDDTNAQSASATSPTAAPITAPVDAPPPTTQAAADAQPSVTQGASDLTATPVVAASPAALPSGSVSSGATTTAVNAVQPSQAELMSSPPVSGTSQPKRGLPKGAVIGIIAGCAVLILLLAAFLFMFLRRRRRARNARRKMLASPILPLQDPEKQSPYFFGGQGAMADKRAQYLEQSQSRMSQYSSDTAATLGGYDPPSKEQGFKGTPGPTPPPPIFVRDSSYTSHSAETTTLNGDDDGYDIADLYSHMDPGAPVRPPRPPELRLSV